MQVHTKIHHDKFANGFSLFVQFVLDVFCRLFFVSIFFSCWYVASLISLHFTLYPADLHVYWLISESSTCRAIKLKSESNSSLPANNYEAHISSNYSVLEIIIFHGNERLCRKEDKELLRDKRTGCGNHT